MKPIKPEIIAAGSFWRFLEMTLDYTPDGRAIVLLNVAEKHRQSAGRVHGGVLATMLDTAMSVAVNQMAGSEERTTTVEMKVNYLRPAMGPHLRAEGDIVKFGRSLAVTEARCYEDGDRLVATASGTFYHWNPQEEKQHGKDKTE